MQKRSISIQGNAKDPDSRGIWRPSIGRESVRKGGHDIEVKNSVKIDHDQAFDDDGHVLRTGANPIPTGTRSWAAAGVVRQLGSGSCRTVLFDSQPAGYSLSWPPRADALVSPNVGGERSAAQQC